MVDAILLAVALGLPLMVLIFRSRRKKQTIEFPHYLFRTEKRSQLAFFVLNRFRTLFDLLFDIGIVLAIAVTAILSANPPEPRKTLLVTDSISTRKTDDSFARAVFSEWENGGFDSATILTRDRKTGKPLYKDITSIVRAEAVDDLVETTSGRLKMHPGFEKTEFPASGGIPREAFRGNDRAFGYLAVTSIARDEFSGTYRVTCIHDRGSTSPNLSVFEEERGIFFPVSSREYGKESGPGFTAFMIRSEGIFAVESSGTIIPFNLEKPERTVSVMGKLSETIIQAFPFIALDPTAKLVIADFPGNKSKNPTIVVSRHLRETGFFIAPLDLTNGELLPDISIHGGTVDFSDNSLFNPRAGFAVLSLIKRGDHPPFIHEPPSGSRIQLPLQGGAILVTKDGPRALTTRPDSFFSEGSRETEGITIQSRSKSLIIVLLVFTMAALGVAKAIFIKKYRD